MTGILMDVKRMAVHDGPGLRTTLFLKGCPLRCVWCHNPEGQSRETQIAWYAAKCIGCDACVRICPQHGARDMSERKKCNACGACALVCPVGARRQYGREITVDEALQIALEDRPFYGNKGGVTLSGGEPLMQADFALEVLHRVKEEGVTTALDTCGHVPWQVFERALPVCDTYLFDLKHMDSDMHRKGTGQGNELILANLEKLSGAGARIQVRIPLLPGFNDSEAHIAKAGEFLAKIQPECVKLLPYHQLARNKYAGLGMEDTLPPGAEDLPARLERATKQLQQLGLNAYHD